MLKALEKSTNTTLRFIQMCRFRSLAHARPSDRHTSRALCCLSYASIFVLKLSLRLRNFYLRSLCTLLSSSLSPGLKGLFFSFRPLFFSRCSFTLKGRHWLVPVSSVFVHHIREAKRVSVSVCCQEGGFRPTFPDWITCIIPVLPLDGDGDLGFLSTVCAGSLVSFRLKYAHTHKHTRHMFGLVH